MTRPAALRYRAVMLVAGAVLAGGGVWWWARPAGFTVRVNPDRNVLLVTIDTLRADVLGSYGGRAITPNLDRLADRGARFDFAHAHAVVTLPSHASILTGRYPYEHGIRDNTGYRLEPRHPTAAALLKPHGFATGAFVGGFPLDSQFGLGAGFDVYDDHLKGSSDGETSERERRADVVVASALHWIGRQERKWFAWVHVYDPHVRYEPPAEWATRFPNDPYLGEVSWTDAALAPLFDRLGSQPRPTLVIVTADHGESLGDHGELTHGVFAYEPVLRVPLIVVEVGPGLESAPAKGIAIESPARHVDLLSTVLEAVGAPDASEVAGDSLLDVMASSRGDDRPSYFEALTPSIVRGWAPLRGVLTSREKYIDLPVPELYDLRVDSGETNNLVRSRSESARVMRNTLRTFNVAAPGRPRQESTETIDRLRSLGYIGGGAAPARQAYTEADDPKRLIELEQTMTRAAEAYGAGRLEEAIGMYRSVIARRADTEDAYRKLALVYWRSGRPDDAIATLETALRTGVTQSEVRNRLAQYLAETGRPIKAIALLEPDAGGDPDALIALGNAYLLAGRAQDAQRAFERLLELDPDNALAHENIGVTMLRVRDYAGAEASLRRAIDIDPDLAGAHTALGVALASTGRRAEAIDAWKRAVTIDGSELNAMYNLTINLVQAGRHEEARVYGERFLATAPPGLREDAAAIKRVLMR